jgi:hypothetical protein
MNTTRKSLADREWWISDAFGSIVNTLAWPFYSMIAMTLCMLIMSFIVMKVQDNPDNLLMAFYLLFERLYVYSGIVMFAMGFAAIFIVHVRIGADASDAYVEKHGDRDFYEEYFANSTIAYCVLSLLTMGALLLGHGYAVGVFDLLRLPVSWIGIVSIFGSVIVAWPAYKAMRAWIQMASFLLEDFAAPLIAIAARFGAEVTMLTGTSLLLVLSGKGTAGDQAMLAASCSLALRELRPPPRVALATVRAWIPASRSS